MTLSARNHLAGTIEDIAWGDAVTAVVKATEVMLAK